MIGDMLSRAASKTQMDWHGATFIHPLAIISLFLLIVWLLWAPRSRAIVPFLILICFIPSAQRLVVAGADFTLLRIMAIAGLTRVLCRGELSRTRFNRLDGCFVAWVGVGSIAFIAQRGELGALVYMCGTSLDALGSYFVARVLVRDKEDLRTFVQSLSVIAIPVSFFFAIELVTQQNYFGLFGGVPKITTIRDDRLRCQGAFSHPILAGVFWAAVAGLTMGGFVSSRRSRGKRIVFAIGTLSSVFIIGASASSTPLLGFLAALFFWSCWYIRGFLRYVFIAAPFVLIGLHMVMEAPVWHLVCRVSAVGGSTAYHRFVLIDSAIRHFDEWWLVGTSSTVHWSEHFQMFDLTNQYVFEGVRGGLGRLLLFCGLIYLASEAIATALKFAKEKNDKLLTWGLGVSVFVHCVCFIGVSYFGQIQYMWYMTLAICSSVGSKTSVQLKRVNGDVRDVSAKEPLPVGTTTMSDLSRTAAVT